MSYLNKGILIIRDRVDEKMAKFVSEALDVLRLAGSPNITILISSIGGDIDAGSDIIDLLSLYPGKKTAVVVGQAASMAAIILQCCDKRMATQHSKILIHHASCKIELDTIRDPKKMEDFRVRLEKYEKIMDEILIKRSKRTAEEIDTQCKKNQFMSAEEAIAFGLLDGVYDKHLPK